MEASGFDPARAAGCRIISAAAKPSAVEVAAGISTEFPTATFCWKVAAAIARIAGQMQYRQLSDDGHPAFCRV